MLNIEGTSKRMKEMERETIIPGKTSTEPWDIVARKTRPSIAEGGGLCGNVRWREYDDGSRQIVVFDKEERDFVPVGDRISAEKFKDKMEAMEIEHMEALKVAEELGYDLYN